MKKKMINAPGIFTFGSYYGRPHVEILALRPEYIVYVYENFRDNGGLSREVYRQAIQIIHDGEEDIVDEETMKIIEAIGNSSED